MTEKEVIAKCPLCGGDVVESAKGYGCSNWKDADGGCKFVIWKNFYDKKLTKAQVKALIEKGKTGEVKGWVSKKTGKTFDAPLKLEKTDDGYRPMFDFGD